MTLHYFIHGELKNLSKLLAFGCPTVEHTLTSMKTGEKEASTFLTQ